MAAHVHFGSIHTATKSEREAEGQRSRYSSNDTSLPPPETASDTAEGAFQGLLSTGKTIVKFIPEEGDSASPEPTAISTRPNSSPILASDRSPGDAEALRRHDIALDFFSGELSTAKNQFTKLDEVYQRDRISEARWGSVVIPEQLRSVSQIEEKEEQRDVELEAEMDELEAKVRELRKSLENAEEEQRSKQTEIQRVQQDRLFIEAKNNALRPDAWVTRNKKMITRLLDKQFEISRDCFRPWHYEVVMGCCSQLPWHPRTGPSDLVARWNWLLKQTAIEPSSGQGFEDETPELNRKEFQQLLEYEFSDLSSEDLLHEALNCRKVSAQEKSHGSALSPPTGQNDPQNTETMDAERISRLELLFRGDLRQKADSQKDEATTEDDDDEQKTLEWDYVIVLANPDHEEAPANRKVQYKEAERLYGSAFRGEEAYVHGVSQQARRMAIEQIAFLDCFCKLRPFNKCIVKGKKPKDEATQREADRWMPPPDATEVLRKTPMCFSQASSFRRDDSQDSGVKKNLFQHGELPGRRCLDLLSLVRNTLLTKLVYHLGLSVKVVFSPNYQYIFVLIAADEMDLVQQAQRTSFPVAIDLLRVDQEAFEPCSSTFRPLSHILASKKDVLEEYVKFVAELEKRKLQEPPEVDESILEFHNGQLKHLRKLQEQKRLLSEKQLPSQKIQDAYKSYLRKRTDGLIALKAIQEVHKETGVRLQSLWDRLKFTTPPISVVTPFDMKITNKWQHHTTFNVRGETFRSTFSPLDRMLLIPDIIARQIDLVYLLQNGYIVDFFPVEDDLLKRTSFLPLKLATLEANKSRVLPFQNRYFSDNQDQTSVVMTRDWTKEPMPVLARGPKGLVGLLTDKMEHIYFGQKIGLYFVFLRHFAKWLSAPALFGLGFWIAHQVLGESSEEVIFLCNVLSLTIWAPLWLASWERHLSSVVLRRGVPITAQITYQEPVRMQFKGIIRRSPVTGEDGEYFFSPFKKLMRYIIGGIITNLFFIIVLGSVVFVSAARVYIHDVCQLRMIHPSLPEFNFSQNIVGGLNACQIFIFNNIYRTCAMKLTIFENHRSYSQFLNSYSVKSVTFQFINSYSSLFYTAFFKEFFEEGILGKKMICDGLERKNCVMSLLNGQLSSLLIVSVAKNVLELGVPLLKYRMKHRATRKAEKAKSNTVCPSPASTTTKPPSIIESIDSQLDQEGYGSAALAFDGTIDEYLELVTTFGFLVLWSPTFPAAGVLSFLCALFEIYVDQYKLKHIHRRPLPQPANDIGVWQSIFNIMAIMAILTNATILVLVPKIEPTWIFAGAKDNMILSWIIWVVVLLLLKVFLMRLSASDRLLRIVDGRLKHVLDMVRHPRMSADLDMRSEKHEFKVKGPSDAIPQGRAGLKAKKELRKLQSKEAKEAKEAPAGKADAQVGKHAGKPPPLASVEESPLLESQVTPAGEVKDEPAPLPAPQSSTSESEAKKEI